MLHIDLDILSVILAPTKFHLLRGNHEHRELQKNFTFYTECLQKFGTPELGEMVWEEINKAFDAMPIAAVVDKKVMVLSDFKSVLVILQN